MEEFTMERVTFNITCSCNLKCRLCGAYIPYLQNGGQDMRQEYPLEHWNNILDRYFKIVTHVNVLAISAGEPRCYPVFSGFIHVLLRYRNAIGRVQIVTNGTIVPSRAVLDAAKEFGAKLYFNVDNYGEVSRAVNEIEILLTQHDIPFTIRNYTRDDPHCGGWVDFGGLTKRVHQTKEETERVFSKCAHAQSIHFCFLIAGREMWPCDPARRRRYLDPSPDCSEYLDLLDLSLSAEAQREKIAAIYAMKSLSACSYCNGLCEDSLRIVPGEQLTQEELSCIRDGARSYEEVLFMLNVKGHGRQKGISHDEGSHQAEN